MQAHNRSAEQQEDSISKTRRGLTFDLDGGLFSTLSPRRYGTSSIVRRESAHLYRHFHAFYVMYRPMGKRFHDSIFSNQTVTFRREISRCISRAMHLNLSSGRRFLYLRTAFKVYFNCLFFFWICQLIHRS